MKEHQELSTREPDLTPADLAEECQVPLGTVYAWNHRGTGPTYYRAGRHVRYPRPDVERWKQEQRPESSGVRPSQ